MPYYESVFIARPDITAAQVETLTETFKSIVGENGGKVTKAEYWGLRNLTFRIRKNRKGHYSLLNLDAPSAAVKELERNMGINEDVLRYVTIRVDELEEGPSIMMRSKGQREERGGRGDRFGGGDRFGRDRDDRFGRDRDDRGRRDDREPREGRPARSETEGEA